MADRIVTTEGIMAGLAHKIIDSNSQPRVVHHYASAYAPAAMPAHYASTGYSNAYANVYAQGQQQTAPAGTLGGKPYMAAKPVPAVAHYGYVTPPDNSRYSASNMIYGVTGATYTAAHPTAEAQAQAAAPSCFGFANMSAVNSSGKMCTSYGVKHSC